MERNSTGIKPTIECLSNFSRVCRHSGFRIVYGASMQDYRENVYRLIEDRLSDSDTSNISESEINESVEMFIKLVKVVDVSECSDVRSAALGHTPINEHFGEEFDRKLKLSENYQLLYAEHEELKQKFDALKYENSFFKSRIFPFNLLLEYLKARFVKTGATN